MGDNYDYFSIHNVRVSVGFFLRLRNGLSYEHYIEGLFTSASVWKCANESHGLLDRLAPRVSHVQS